jgi:hypothetical protein
MIDSKESPVNIVVTSVRKNPTNALNSPSNQTVKYKKTNQPAVSINFNQFPYYVRTMVTITSKTIHECELTTDQMIN